MTSDAYPPWEPPFAGSETEHVLGSLDRLRVTFRWKADGLDADRIHAVAAPSALTVAGLLKHLAAQEDYAAQVKVAGEPMPSVWDDNGWNEDDEWSSPPRPSSRPASSTPCTTPPWSGRAARSEPRSTTAVSAATPP